MFGPNSEAKLYEVYLGDDSRHWPDWNRALDAICGGSHRWTIQDRSRNDAGQYVLLRTDREVKRGIYLVREVSFGEWYDAHPMFSHKSPVRLHSGEPEVGQIAAVLIDHPDYPWPLRQCGIIRGISGDMFDVEISTTRIERPYKVGQVVRLHRMLIKDWASV